MRLIVADTSPLVYLVLINHIDVLHAELRNPLAPAPVLAWAASLPQWIEVRKVLSTSDDAALLALGVGERAAIMLALSIHADLVLIDERKGTQAALDKGLDATGTLGILQRAARRGFLNLAEAFDRLKETNFRYHQHIMDKLLAEQKKGN